MLVSACGGSTPPPAAPVPNDDTGLVSSQQGGAMPQVSQELGSIDPNAVERTFEKYQNRIQGCFKQGQQRIEYLDGDVSVFLRIGQDGAVRYGYFEDSTVGDRQTEKCILDLLASASWPKPQGGEAEVRKSFGFDAGDVRPPTDWSPDKIAAALGKAQKRIDDCKGGVSGTFKGAAYIQPDGKKGKVQAVGLAAPSKEGADKIDCLVGVVQGLEVPSPGSYAAKVSLGL